MDKLAMLSVLFATAAIPVAFARDADPRRGVKRMIVALAAFYCVYVGYVGWIHTAYFVPKAWMWSR
jgi:hypothetical protein